VCGCVGVCGCVDVCPGQRLRASWSRHRQLVRHFFLPERTESVVVVSSVRQPERPMLLPRCVLRCPSACCYLGCAVSFSPCIPVDCAGALGQEVCYAFATGLEDSMRFLATISRSASTLETTGTFHAWWPQSHSLLCMLHVLVMSKLTRLLCNGCVMGVPAGSGMTAAVAAYPDAFYSGISFWANASNCKIVESCTCDVMCPAQVAPVQQWHIPMAHFTDGVWLCSVP